MPRLILPLLICMLAGCALVRNPWPAPPMPAASASTIVIVANGAGDFRTAANNLAGVVVETGASVRVETFPWSKGYGRSVADQVDRENQQFHGRRLAEHVLACRQANPDIRICLLGQSAGGSVVLIAAECLPPGSVDRIVLLSPSVSPGHDLRTVLQTSREGLDLFHSNRDYWVLGIGMRLVGTTDGERRPAAGKVGFRPIVNNPADAVLYAKLRQHPWDRSDRALDHNGFHFGNLEPKFMRAYVLPILMGEQSGR